MPSKYDMFGDAVRSVIPMRNKWFLNPAKHPHNQPLVEKVLEANRLQRQDMRSGAYVDPKTLEILDGQIFSRGFVNSWDGRKPQMLVEGGTPLAAEGGLLDANLVRRDQWNPVGSPDLEGLEFIATIEAQKAGGVPAQHYYARQIQYDTPVLLRNTYTGKNPTMRPRARGSIFADGDLGRMLMTSSGQVHPVYDTLRVVDRNAYDAIPVGDRNQFGRLLRYSLLAPATLGADGLVNPPPAEELMEPAF